MNHNTSHWLALSQVPQLGMTRIDQLLTDFGAITDIIAAPPAQLEKHKLTAQQIEVIKNPKQQWIEDALEWQTQNPTHHIIVPTDPRCPQLLNEIPNRPIILFAIGDVALLSQPQIAIVGSRNPTHTGLEIARGFAFELTQAGLCVTSGLASGIDTAAHEGALSAGKTIAVLGSGLHHIYPKQNQALAHKVTTKGCLISEFPLHTTPTRENFPRRNRIISGLSLGTLVVEAALKSGSLITARFAMEQNRDVFAIPGSIRNAASQGCLSLIQQGAKCVTRVADITEEWGIQRHCRSVAESVQYDHFDHNRLDPADRQVLACIENEVTSVDQICSRSKLAAGDVASALLRLELAGAVKMQYGGYVCLSSLNKKGANER